MATNASGAPLAVAVGTMTGMTLVASPSANHTASTPATVWAIARVRIRPGHTAATNRTRGMPTISIMARTITNQAVPACRYVSAADAGAADGRW